MLAAIFLADIDMTTIFLAGFCLGIATLWIFLELIALMARRRVPPLTLHRRKNRDRPVPYIPPAWEREEGGVDYRFINLTGEER
jgi:hypothetical protein